MKKIILSFTALSFVFFLASVISLFFSEKVGHFFSALTLISLFLIIVVSIFFYPGNILYKKYRIKHPRTITKEESESKKDGFYITWKRIFLYYSLLAIFAILISPIYLKSIEEFLDFLGQFLLIGFWGYVIFFLQHLYKNQQIKTRGKKKVDVGQKDANSSSNIAILNENKKPAIKYSALFFIYKIILVVLFFPAFLVLGGGAGISGNIIAVILVLIFLLSFIPAYIGADKKQKGSTSKKDLIQALLPIFIYILIAALILLLDLVGLA